MKEGRSEDAIARERLDALEKRIGRDEQENIRRFAGFPQEYAQKTEVELLRKQIETIRVDHVARREVIEVKDAQRQAAEDLRKRLDEASGRQAATRVGLAVVVTLLSLAFGAIWKDQLTHGDVSQQIQNEAPWLRDRGQIEREIQTLESSQATQSEKIAAIQALDKFFCATRVKAQLPGC